MMHPLPTITMTAFLRSFLPVALLALLAGCATPAGKTKYPEPTAGFAPKVTYALPVDKLWDATLSALERNRITVASTDKASGTLQTDYSAGQSYLIGGGFIAAQSTRYKYNLAARTQADGATKLTVICKVESTMKGESGASQWTDVSGQNPELIQRLETWLYEQIEKELPKS
jgi:hypothetical protein